MDIQLLKVIGNGKQLYDLENSKDDVFHMIINANTTFNIMNLMAAEWFLARHLVKINVQNSELL